MAKRRIVITGLGIVSPVGSTVVKAWDNVLAGRSGIGPITHFDATAYPTRIAGEVRDLDLNDYLSTKDARRMDPFIHYGMVASIQAVRDAGLEAWQGDPTRVGVMVGAGIGGIHSIEATSLNIAEHKGPRRVTPFFVPMSIINMVSGNLSIMFGFKGPNLSIVTACTSATHCIGVAARLIAYGDAEVMIAGGAEFAGTTLGLGGFCAARALSTRNDEPTRASRPWDKDRDGFVLSDGAGVVVVEEYEHAKRRGAKIYAEIIGFGMSGDAYHMTSPPEDGEGARQCMAHALRDAQLNPEQVQYVNAHGTSTLVGDKGETVAIKRAFGDHATSLAVSSTKSMTGHLLGAAGGIEAIFCVLALRDQVIPPTINLDNPDEGCDLDYVPGTSRQAKLDVVFSNSFGFGGTNGTLALRRP